MKLRCRVCNGKLGLGVVSLRVYVPEVWRFTVYRFCGREHRDRFLRQKAQDLEKKKAVSLLFRPP